MSDIVERLESPFNRPSLAERIAQAKAHMHGYRQHNDSLWPHQRFALTVGELLDAAEAGLKAAAEITRLRAALSQQAGWQPIETAPKDGTVVWAYNGEQGRMHWTAGTMPGGDWALWVWDDQTLADVDPEPVQPTYWRPLPAPPAAAAPQPGAQDG